MQDVISVLVAELFLVISNLLYSFMYLFDGRLTESQVG